MKVFLIGLVFLGSGIVVSTDDSNNEFQGRIDFKVEIETKNNSVNKKDLESFFGVNKAYFFKDGKYKWLTEKGNIEFEIFNYQIDSLHTISKRAKNDTLYFNNFFVSDDKIISIDSVDVLKICGIKCQGVKFNMTNSQKMAITRILYFPIDTLKYAKNHYYNQNGMCNNFIHEFGGSIPLKLILDIEGVPYKMTYTAQKITPEEIEDKEFELNTSKPKKYR